ncbi:hypothetical protein OBP_016 [Pseudomonas phage OBP]|uniref:hypothetical protein n=1 Tax=Pseudomonas phage OBP TaxID=1124849 RepID=UPI000240D60D|nr:hypothetical protein OBP_016 [Pseudomonas phage OBP]AEV89453.1 hypothetical protein OBP_016 [Pseudomonas phage OBP]
MQVEQYRSLLSAQLSKTFKVDQIRASVVPPSQLNGPLLRSMTVYCYEFFINSCERYFTFAVELDGKVFFTRPKEGIREYLTPLIRNKDFGFALTGEIHNHKDVVGKFIESKINRDAWTIMGNTLADELGDESMISFDYWFGFKVTRHHKEALSFDSDVELMIRRKDSPDIEVYRGNFVDGNIGTFRNKYNETVTMREVARR